MVRPELGELGESAAVVGFLESSLEPRCLEAYQVGLACLAGHLLDLQGNYQIHYSTLQKVKLHVLQVRLQPGIRAVQMELDLQR